MKRIWQYVGINTLIAVLCIPALYFSIGDIGIAAFLGAWPAFIIATYDRFVNRPDLSFSYNNKNTIMYKPELQRIDKNGHIWHYLRIVVKNSGMSMAKNCTAELRVKKYPTKDGLICSAPANEPKALLWAGVDDESRNIPARKGEATLNVLVEDTYVNEQLRMKWADAEKWGPLRLWVANRFVCNVMIPEHRLQDAFCEGDYNIEIIVFPENGKPASQSFKLHIAHEWIDTTLAKN